MKNALFLCIGNFFRSLYVAKTPFGAFFSRKMGHFLFQRGWQPWNLFKFPNNVILADLFCVFFRTLTWATLARSEAPRSSRQECGGFGRRTAGKRPSK